MNAIPDPDQQRRLDGRVAVVTGASSGNGRATALALARAGAAVACSDLQPERLAQGFEDEASIPTHEQIQATGGEASYVGADVTSPEEMEALGAHAIAAHGRIRWRTSTWSSRWT